jgi:hypothetical protein
MPTNEHNSLTDETMDVDALTLERSLYPFTEDDEVAAFIDDEYEAEHDRYSNDWEG